MKSRKRMDKVVLTAAEAVADIRNGAVIAATYDEGSSCGGTVIINGDDDATYTYCHLSDVFANSGTNVAAGELIATSGGQP